jgi:hypothetical protein
MVKLGLTGSNKVLANTNLAAIRKRGRKLKERLMEIQLLNAFCRSLQP